jgi:hypothetical protein
MQVANAASSTGRGDPSGGAAASHSDTTASAHLLAPHSIVRFYYAKQGKRGLRYVKLAQNKAAYSLCNKARVKCRIEISPPRTRAA